VQLVYADYPLQIHPNAVPAAEAARCAGDQNAYWQMHDLLFANQNQWSSLADPAAQFTAYAQHVGIDTSAFSSCLAKGTHRQEVLQARTAAEQLGLPGTPSFAVNGKPLDTSGAQSVDDIVDRLRQAVDAALAAQ
jgi:protein-disulfide isomerase